MKKTCKTCSYQFLNNAHDPCRHCRTIGIYEGSNWTPKGEAKEGFEYLEQYRQVRSFFDRPLRMD